MEVDLEVNTEKSKYKLLPGTECTQNYDIKIADRSFENVARYAPCSVSAEQVACVSSFLNITPPTNSL
jgi:hypothetical protein